MKPTLLFILAMPLAGVLLSAKPALAQEVGHSATCSVCDAPWGTCVHSRPRSSGDTGGVGGQSGGQQSNAEADRLAALRAAANAENELGLQAYNAQDWEGAAAHFREALTSCPDDKVIKSNLAIAESQLQAWHDQQAQQARERAAATIAATEKFKTDKQEALRWLKGIPGDLHLKVGPAIKDHNSAGLGVKSIGDPEIRSIKPDNESRDLSTAWKQVHYAAAIMQYALKAAAGNDLVETKYLASEGLRALNGDPLGIQLNIVIPPMDTVRAADLKQLMPSVKSALQATVAQIDKIQATTRELHGQEVKPSQLKGQEPPPTKPVPPPAPLPVASEPVKSPSPKTSDEAQIARAAAEQKAFQAVDQKQIDEVFKKQKDNEALLREALATVRELQALINK